MNSVACGISSGRSDVQAVELVPVVVLVLLRELRLGRAPLRGAGDDLVLDVGDVAHVGDARNRATRRYRRIVSKTTAVRP